MRRSMISKDEAMQKIRETHFAMLDAGLYLDTHPDDEAAMDYFNEYQQLHKEAVLEYENCFGPVTLSGVNTCDGWTWTRDSWPWKGGCK